LHGENGCLIVWELTGPPHHLRRQRRPRAHIQARLHRPARRINSIPGRDARTLREDVSSGPSATSFNGDREASRVGQVVVKVGRRQQPVRHAGLEHGHAMPGRLNNRELETGRLGDVELEGAVFASISGGCARAEVYDKGVEANRYDVAVGADTR